MIIAQNALDTHLKKGCAPVYMVLGQEPYLFQQAVLSIKRAFRLSHRQDEGGPEEIVLDILQPQDWVDSFQQANTYTLFSDSQLLDLRFAKKSLDAAAKNALQTYADQPNTHSLVLIQAPDLPFKQMQALHNHLNIAIIQVQPYSPPAFKKFIIQRLQALQLTYESDIPDMIYQYHQANLLACNQFLELLACIHESSQALSSAILLTYLRDQSEFSMYELGEACLNGQLTHAIHIVRQIQHAQEEPILVLWILGQELRKITQIHHLVSTLSFQAACQQLKIWTQKIPFYQRAWQRVSLAKAHELLKYCQTLDEQMKSHRNAMIWQELENIIVKICA